MPQTLLAISAIVITGFLTLSQGEISRRTGESVVTDQFELAVAGTLLHTMEFVDSRAFDEATTPEKLRQRLGLPKSMSSAERDTISFDDLRMIRVEDFGTPGSFGTGNCDIETPPASCDDVDDIADGKWHALDLKTSEKDPLPVEVKVDVTYVEAAAGKAIDEPVKGTKRTFHKRVEVIARTNAIRLPGGGSRPVQVALRRVISFDPEVAAEYLRRSIDTDVDGPGSCEAQVGPWNTRMTELRDALEAAQNADRAAALAVSGATTDRDDARQRAAAADERRAVAEGRVQTTADAAAAAERAAERALAAHNESVETARRANETRDAAKTAFEKAAAAAEPLRTKAKDKKTAYTNAETKVTQTKGTFDAATDELVPLLNKYTILYRGTYYRKDGVTDAQWNQVVQSYNRYISARDTYDNAKTARDTAQQASQAADKELADAVADSDSKSAAYTSARNAATAAAQNVADARSAADTASAAVTANRNDAASAAQELSTAQADARAAADTAAAAQGAVDRAQAAAAETSGDASAAAQAVRNHEATQPQCD